MKDAFIGAMCLLLLVDFYGRFKDNTTDVSTYWWSLGFNGVMLGWGLIAISMRNV